MSETIQGHVRREPVSVGSKSEREAVVIRVDDGRVLLLRLKGGPAIDDPALDVLVGKHIVAEGVATTTSFIMQRYSEGEAPRRRPGGR